MCVATVFSQIKLAPSLVWKLKNLFGRYYKMKVKGFWKWKYCFIKTDFYHVVTFHIIDYLKYVNVLTEFFK